MGEEQLIITEQVDTYIDDTELRELFEGKQTPSQQPEVDPDTGLEVVSKESIFSKYGLEIDVKTSSFHASLQKFFDRAGFLTERQLNALRRN